MAPGIGIVATAWFVVCISSVQSFPLVVVPSRAARSCTRLRDAETTPLAPTPIPSIDAFPVSSQAQRVAVLVCPAQFCVPADYDGLKERLALHINSDTNDRILIDCQVAPLPRTEWIRVAQQLPTLAFLQGKLPLEETLRWYFSAIEQGLADLFARHGPDINICLVGHSMGGWVARAYMGGQGMSSTAVQRLAMSRITSLVTLGTPHQSAPSVAWVDQTRGLLAAIDAAPSCAPHALIEAYSRSNSRGNQLEITCVCSDAVTSKLLTSNVEELVATASYLPLVGQLNASGDGIVPLELAFLDAPARRVVVNTCAVTQQPIRHAHVLPTPWNLWDGYAPSIPLDQVIPSYVSEGVVPQWASYVR